MRSKKIPFERFRKAVYDSFNLIINKFSFELKKESDYVFKATSINCCITIYLDWPNIVVGIKPASNSEFIGATPFYNEIGLEWIIKYFDPNSDYVPATLDQDDEIKSETDRLVTLLLQYCEPMLNGDFSQWSNINEFAKKSLGERDQEQNKGINQTHINLIRGRAEDAFREKKYKEAAELYKSIQKELTPLEEKRMEYAKKGNKWGRGEPRGRS